MTPEDWSRTYREFGILRYSAILSTLGIAGPTERIVLLVRFITSRLGSEAAPPPHVDDSELDGWMTRALADSVRALPSPDWAECSLQDLFEESASLVGWNPYVEFAEILHVECGPKAYNDARFRLASRGFDSREFDLMGLPDAFVHVRLPQALRTFKPSLGVGKETAWLAQVFYRFALKAILKDPFQRSVLDITTTAKSNEPTPEQALETNAFAKLASQVGQHLEALPVREQSAVRLYFGLPSRPNETPEFERSFRQIAAHLGCSEYLAREAVVDGLAELAVRLSITGPFSKCERELMRYVFLEKMDLHAAAQHMSMHLNDARHVLGAIGRKLRGGLRDRTTYPGSEK